MQGFGWGKLLERNRFEYLKLKWLGWKGVNWSNLAGDHHWAALHVAKSYVLATQDRNWVSISNCLVTAYQFSTYVPNSLSYHSTPRYPRGHCPAICHKDCKHHVRDGSSRQYVVLKNRKLTALTKEMYVAKIPLDIHARLPGFLSIFHLTLPTCSNCSQVKFRAYSPTHLSHVLQGLQDNKTWPRALRVRCLFSTS